MKRILSIAFVLVLAVGCSQQPEAITDEKTSRDILFVVPEEGHMIYQHQYDNMDRGQFNYYQHPLVVNPHHYEDEELRRGDVIFFDSPEFIYKENPDFELSEQGISRIVALPGERISIKEGQVFINERTLDTFYGKAHRLGSDLNELRQLLEKVDLKDNVRQNTMNMIEYFEAIGMEEMTVPDNHVFVIGDDWFRSADSLLYGPLPAELIHGKVLGYLSGS